MTSWTYIFNDYKIICWPNCTQTMMKNYWEEKDSNCFFLAPLLSLKKCYDPAGIYLLKVNNRNTRARCEICSKLTIKAPERCHWHRSGGFIVNSEHISPLVLVFLLLTLNR